MVLWTVLNWGITILFIKWFGYNGVAAASFLVAASVLLILPQVKKYVHFSFYRPIWKQFIASVLMGLFVFALGHFITSLITLALVMILAAVFYIGFLYLIGQKEIKPILGFVYNVVVKKL